MLWHEAKFLERQLLYAQVFRRADLFNPIIQEMIYLVLTDEIERNFTVNLQPCNCSQIVEITPDFVKQGPVRLVRPNCRSQEAQQQKASRFSLRFTHSFLRER